MTEAQASNAQAARTRRAERAAGDRGGGDPGRSGGVPAVAGAIRILRHLADAKTPVGVTPLARALGMNTSTCFNILRTLAEGELVRFDAAARTYSVGLGLVDLALAAVAQGGDLGLVQSTLRQLALRRGATVTLWRPAGPDRMVLTLVAESDQVMRIRMSVGQRLPLLIGAMGRVVAAFGGMGEAEMRRRFEGLRWQRPLPFEIYLAEVEEARRRGWAVDEGHYVQGVTTVSAPVLGPLGAIQALCSATLLGVSHGPDAMAQMGAELIETCRSIRRAYAFD